MPHVNRYVELTRGDNSRGQFLPREYLYVTVQKGAQSIFFSYIVLFNPPLGEYILLELAVQTESLVSKILTPGFPWKNVYTGLLGRMFKIYLIACGCPIGSNDHGVTGNGERGGCQVAFVFFVACSWRRL